MERELRRNSCEWRRLPGIEKGDGRIGEGIFLSLPTSLRSFEVQLARFYGSFVFGRLSSEDFQTFAKSFSNVSPEDPLLQLLLLQLIDFVILSSFLFFCLALAFAFLFPRLPLSSVLGGGRGMAMGIKPLDRLLAPNETPFTRGEKAPQSPSPLNLHFLVFTA